MIKIYDNLLGYIDNSGVRLYIGNELRPYDLGGLTFGMDPLPSSLAIPPQFNGFSVDSYCTADASLDVCFQTFSYSLIKAIYPSRIFQILV